MYLDANILFRLVANDIPEQVAKASYYIDTAAPESLIVEAAVLSEVCFVLEFHQYRMERVVIAESLIDLLELAAFEKHSDIFATLELYKTHPKLDFVDCLLYVKGGKDGVYTFDKRLLG